MLSLVLTPQDISEFLSSFAKAFQLDDQYIRRINGMDGLPIIIEKPAIEDWIRQADIPMKVSVIKSNSWSPVLLQRHESELSPRYVKERMSYLMPYSHKHGKEYILPQIFIQRRRCHSMPFIKSSVITRGQFKVFDNGEEMAGNENGLDAEESIFFVSDVKSCGSEK